MHPFREGRIVFRSSEHDGVMDGLIGPLCVVQVRDGPMLLKFLRRGRSKNLWDLESSNAPIREDAALEWAAKVIDIRPA